MALSIEVQEDKDCLLSAEDCLKVCMTSDALVYQTGDLFEYYLYLLDFIVDHVSDMGNSILEVDGVTFTFISGANNPSQNQISIAGDIFMNIYEVLQANWYVSKNYEVSIVFASGILFKHKVCGRLSAIRIYNIDAGSGDIDLVETSLNGTPQNFGFYENYRVLACLFCDGVLITELIAYPQIQLTADECDVLTDPKICLEVSNFVKDCLSTPLPSLAMPIGSPIATAVPTMVSEVSLVITEAYGADSLNIHGKEETYFIGDVIGANYCRNLRADNDRLEPYCPESTPQQFLYLHDADTLFCRNQAVWLYLYTGIRENYLLNITLGIYDNNGVLIANFPYALPVDAPMLELQASLYFYSDQMLDFLGVNRSDIGKTTLQVEYIHPDTLALIQTEEVCFNYYKKDCCDCDLQLVFLSSLDTFTTIMAKCPVEERLNIFQKTIELCEPCMPSTQSRGSTTIDSRSYIELDTYILNPQNYSKKVLRDFYASKEVYLLYQGNYYTIIPQNQSQTLYQKGQRTNLKYTFRLPNERL